MFFSRKTNAQSKEIIVHPGVPKYDRTPMPSQSEFDQQFFRQHPIASGQPTMTLGIGGNKAHAQETDNRFSFENYQRNGGSFP